MHGIILFGKPGSGKSTIGKTFAEMYGYQYISSGDLARHMADNDPAIADMLASGNMAPEMTMRSMVKYGINKCINHDQNFVLDGFPRFDYQDTFLDNSFPNLALIRVLVDVNDSVAINRCMDRNRGDDNYDAIMARMDYYHKNTEGLTKTCSIVLYNNDECEAYRLADELYMEVSKQCH